MTPYSVKTEEVHGLSFTTIVGPTPIQGLWTGTVDHEEVTEWCSRLNAAYAAGAASRDGEAELARLLFAVHPYTHHRTACPRNMGRECNCGLLDLDSRVFAARELYSLVKEPGGN